MASARSWSAVRTRCWSSTRELIVGREFALDGYAGAVPLPRFLKGRTAKEPPVAIGDPRFEGWETVTAFEDQETALAWRDQLRAMGLDASCVADRPLDGFGRGDIYLVVPPQQWSRATEIVENLE